MPSAERPALAPLEIRVAALDRETVAKANGDFFEALRLTVKALRFARGLGGEAAARGIDQDGVPPSVRFASAAIARSTREPGGPFLAIVKQASALPPVALTVLGKSWPADDLLESLSICGDNACLERRPMRGLVVDEKLAESGRYYSSGFDLAEKVISVSRVDKPIDADITLFSFHMPDQDIHPLSDGTLAPGYFEMILSIETARRALP